MVVNGPIARELNINCGDNLFGPGWRANAAIGRAIRLIMRNVIGTLPGCSTAVAWAMAASTATVSLRTRPTAPGRRCTWSAAFALSRMP